VGLGACGRFKFKSAAGDLNAHYRDGNQAEDQLLAPRDLTGDQMIRSEQTCRHDQNIV
jgi:hypothetical protein